MNKYDNWFSDAVLSLVGTIVRTLERAIVVFWDGMRSTTEHGTPAVLGFIAAVLPAVAPLPVAGMTAYSLMTYLSWQPWQALTMAATIEGTGFVLWVTLVETLLEGGWKGTVMQVFFSVAVLVYETLLVTINAVLAWSAGEQGQRILILFLACLFPALTAISYGYRNHGNKAALERERQEAKAEAEKIRQEARQDRKEARELKLRYAAEAKGEKLDQPFRKR